MTTMNRELALRAHIRALLLDYCLTHLTTNYISHTENAVATLLSESLDYVPTFDPRSLTLPDDPLETILKQVFEPSLREEDKWIADADTLKHIRTSLHFPVTKLTTLECWKDEVPEVHDYYQPMTPVLSRRAVLETRLTKVPNNSKLSNAASSTSFTFIPVPVPDISDPPMPSIEDVLNIKYSVDPTTHAAVIATIKKVPTSTKAYVNTQVEKFLCCESPPIHFIDLESPPIFPRKRNTSHHITSRNTLKLAELPTRIPLVNIEEDEEPYMEHMSIVNGWQTYHQISSPPPTPSLAEGDSSSQVDELFPMSPEKDINSVLEFESAKMAEVQILRNNQKGRGSKLPRAGEGKSFAAFLSTRLPDMDRVASTEIGMPPSPQKDLGLSMLGQPPTALTDPINEHVSDADPFLEKVWDKVRNVDFADVILKDGLDTKDGLLVKVPELPEPNAHPAMTFLPRGFDRLVAPQEPLALKEVKGLKPLNLELSWMPVKWKLKGGPTNEDVLGVSDGPILRPDAKQLLEKTIDADKFPTVDPIGRLFDTWDEDQDFIYDILADDALRVFDIVFTREERMSIAGYGSVQRRSEPYQIPGKKGAEDCEDFLMDFETEDPSSRKTVLNRSFDDYGHLRAADSLFHPDNEGLLDSFQFAGDGGSLQNLVMDSEPPQKRAKVTNSKDLDLEPHAQENYSFQDDSGVAFSVAGNSHDEHLAVQTKQTPQPSFGSQEYSQLVQFDDWLDPEAFSPLPFDLTQETHPRTSQPMHTAAVQKNDLLLDDIPILPPPARATTTENQQLALRDFLALRGKTLAPIPEAPAPSELAIPVESRRSPSLLATVAPEALMDRSTINLSEPPSVQEKSHQYLASFDLIQKRALVRSLASAECAVDLVERESLGGADLILDHETAAIFITLMALPSECDSVNERISYLSWRFRNLLVVFECFPSSQAYTDSSASVRRSVNSFSPPVIKAVKKLRRGLSIAEGLGTKRNCCEVTWAFADDVNDAARFARFSGDMAEARDTSAGALWQQRYWLMDAEDEAYEGEDDLANVTGLNNFVACVILSQVDLSFFLELSPQSRVDNFSAVLGVDRMVELNQVLLRQKLTMGSSSPLPDSDFRDSSSWRK